MNEELFKRLLVKFNEDESKESNYDLVNLFNQVHNLKSIDNDKNIYENEDESYDADNSVFGDAQSTTDFNLEQKLIDEHLQRANIVADFRKNGLSKLFINSEPSLTDSDTASFDSDTEIDSLGGLSLWHLTAILISFLIFVCKCLNLRSF
jgi:hypothetical protein